MELATYVHNNIADTDIIFLTGYDEFDYARAAVRSAVFSDYLFKPLQDAELHAILDKLAKKRSAGRPGATPQVKAHVSPDAAFPLEDVESSVLVQRARDYIQMNYSKPISFERSRKRFGG